ncbi:hypothetical protein B0H14DRAFT_3456804 [Mycena olivaceomarginata]|nr:hypothetical protein B0H14DRAFT_3456804 [Mycena olivaceomarginata]
MTGMNPASPSPPTSRVKSTAMQRLKKLFHLDSLSESQTISPSPEDTAGPHNSGGAHRNRDSRPQTSLPANPAAQTPMPATHGLTPVSGGEQQGKSSQLEANAKLAWHGFRLVAKNVEGFLDSTPFKIPVAVLNIIIDTADAVIDNKELTAELLLPIGQRLEILGNALKSKQVPKGIDRTFERFTNTLRRAAEDLQKMHDAGLLRRVLEGEEHTKEIGTVFRRVDEARKNFELELNLTNFRLINPIKDDTEVLRLERFRPINEVRYGMLDRKPPVKPCATGTREEVIDNVISWCKDTSLDAPGVYWLSGMAGTGKTTIAYTICERLFNDGKASRLGASFFCWRQIEAAWDTSASDREGLPPLVVVVDALDELEDDEEQNNFLQDLITKIDEHEDHLHGLKFFVTSRRDPRIMEAADVLPPGVIYHLEGMPTSTVDADISRYLQASLPLLPHEQLRRLTAHASGLFIYAATAVRFIIPPYTSQHPPPFSIQNERLQTLLNGWPNKSRRGDEGLLVDRLYEDILGEYLNPLSEFDRRTPLAVLHTVLSAEGTGFTLRHSPALE